MAKYHFDKESGRTGKCTAQPGNCPKGVADEAHGTSPAEARQAFEAHVEREEGLSAAGGAVKKSTLAPKPEALGFLKNLDKACDPNNPCSADGVCSVHHKAGGGPQTEAEMGTYTRWLLTQEAVAEAAKGEKRASGDAAPVDSNAIIEARSTYLQARNANPEMGYEARSLLNTVGTAVEAVPMTPAEGATMLGNVEGVAASAARRNALMERMGYDDEGHQRGVAENAVVAQAARQAAASLRAGGAVTDVEPKMSSFQKTLLEREGREEARQAVQTLEAHSRYHKDFRARDREAYMKEAVAQVKEAGLKDPRSQAYAQEMQAQLKTSQEVRKQAAAHRKWLAEHTVAQAKTKSYAIRMTEEDGRLEGSIHSLRTSRYTPDVYLRDKGFGGEERPPQVQTTSYGSLDPAEARKVAAELRHGADVADTIDGAYNGRPEERGSKPAYDEEKLKALPKQAERPSQRTKRPERTVTKNENKLVYFKKANGERDETPSHVVVREMTIGGRQVQFRAIEGEGSGRLIPEASISRDREAYQPEIYVRHRSYGEEDSPVEAQVQTTSYGALSTQEVRKVADELENGALVAREVQRQYEKFLEDIKKVKRPRA